jgi:hypothetical protein
VTEKSGTGTDQKRIASETEPGKGIGIDPRETNRKGKNRGRERRNISGRTKVESAIA